MPNHIKERIASLLELIKGGLRQENLDKMVCECDALAQDTSYVLAFFVLKQVFAETSGALEGEAVALGRYQDLTSEIAASASAVLGKALNNKRIEAADLEPIVGKHIRNLNIFRSDR